MMATSFAPPVNHRLRAFDVIKDALEEQIPTGYQPQLEKDDLLQGESNLDDDRSGPLFSIYLEMAGKQDKNMADGLKADADRLLVFSGLFSVIVAIFLAISVQDLRPDPLDKPTFYVENIYQLLADPNGTRVPTPPTLFNPPTFSPSNSAIWVNSLWFLSLVITLSCALLAMLSQWWARRYMKVTQPPSANSLHQRAQIRAFFHKGAQDLRLHWAVDALPILLHAALVIFLAGLLIFTMRSSQTVFKVVVSWVGFCTVVYACFTLLPIFRLDSPYCTPLSSPLWLLYTGALSLGFRVLRWLTAFNCCNDKIWDRFGCLKDDYQRRFSHGIERVAEERAQQSSPEIDNRILLWTLQSSRQDHELEHFFEVVPNFYGLRFLDNTAADSKTSTCEKMAHALVGLMDRTLSSNLLPQSTKQRRIMICNRAMAEAPLLINRRTLGRVLYDDWSGLLDSVEFGLLLRKASYSDRFAEYYSQCVVSVIVAKAQQHDDHWFELSTSQLRMSRSTLEYYLAHGDSVSLANCIFICRRTFEAYIEHGWNCDVYSRSKTLVSVSRFNVQDTLPELQHDFCEMWNELVRNTGVRRSRNLPIYILKHIRNIYFELHRDTIAVPTAFTDTTPDNDSILLFPSSYPLCMIERHHPKPSSSMIDGVRAKQTEVTSPKDAPPVLDNATAVALTSKAQVTPANSRSQRLPPGLPSPEPRSVIEGDAQTHTNSFSPEFMLPPSNPLRIRDHRAETVSNTSVTTTPLTTARAVHTPTNAGRTGAFSAVMQSVDDLPVVSQQSDLIAPPSRAVLRKDDRRLNGPLAESTYNTPLTPASGPIPYSSGEVSALTHSFETTTAPSSIGGVASRDTSDHHVVSGQAVPGTPSPFLPFSVREDTIPTYSQSTPTSSMSQSDDSPSRTGSLETNHFITVLPQQQQSAQFVPATTPDLSPSPRDTRSSLGGKDGSGKFRTTPSRLPTVAS